jgi:hypothetical protein
MRFADINRFEDSFKLAWKRAAISERPHGGALWLSMLTPGKV